MSLEGVIPKASRLMYLTQFKPWTLAMAMVTVIIALIIFAAIAAVWGILVLVGLILIISGAAVVFLQRGNTDFVFYVAIIVGVFFIILSAAGVELGYVDFSTVPGLKHVSQFFIGG